MGGRPPPGWLSTHTRPELVHDAILADQFWAFTDEVWDEPIARRHREVEERSGPTLPAPRKA